MKVLFEKLKRLKFVLKAFNSENFGSISQKVAAKKDQLAAVQQQILHYPSAHDIEFERRLTIELQDLLKHEESFYRQKSRVNWIKEGDMNTYFFHRAVAAKSNGNQIRTLTDGYGNRLETCSLISHEIISFYQGLLGTQNSAVKSCPSGFLQELLLAIPEAVLANLC
ncbi:hypothetical protein PTKIN_Ptkin07bG0101100 [Pterospermum kingtungense]